MPLRLVFYNYFSHFWIGSLGIFSLVIFSLLYFSKKGKLGYIGTILLKIIDKRVKGKLGIGFIVMSVIVIYLSSLIVVGSAYGTYDELKIVRYSLAKQGIVDIPTLINTPKVLPGPMQFIIDIGLEFTPNQFSFAVIHILNEFSHGWMQSMFTIFLIEELEVLGIILFLRYKQSISMMTRE